MGHDFPKDKDVWGNLSSFGQWVENPCVFFPCLIPTTFIMKDCWWLRQLMILGVGRQDCQSSPTCTLHHCWLHDVKKLLPSLPRGFHSFHDELKHSRTPLSHTSGFLSIHAQARSYSSSCRGHCLLIILMHMLVYPRSSSSTDSVDSAE